jgi:hypothetical protein
MNFANVPSPIWVAMAAVVIVCLVVLGWCFTNDDRGDPPQC